MKKILFILTFISVFAKAQSSLTFVYLTIDTTGNTWVGYSDSLGQPRLVNFKGLNSSIKKLAKDSLSSIKINYTIYKREY